MTHYRAMDARLAPSCGDLGDYFCYAAEYRDGTVKVGRTKNPKQRMQALKAGAPRAHFGQMVRFYVSRKLNRREDPLNIELVLLQSVGAEADQELTEPYGEFFRGIQFDRVVDLFGFAGIASHEGGAA